ncbi:uncharacterized protein [Hetaerina americana]|uniref:uncharacterized protein n=1 Tax=Hetaerina americana TaxID=62018 RepID=UPI003A7F56B8
MTFKTHSLLALALLALVAFSSAAPASLYRKSGRTASTDASTTSSPSSWSKKTALAPLPDSALVPFVTSRVERVPKPEEVPTARRRPSKSRASSIPSVDNYIDDDSDVPKAPKATKGPKQASRRRWGPDAYNLFADTEPHSPSYSVLRKVPTKYIRKVQLPYQRTPMAYESTGSVTSSTISVAPIRYKIIDMGDPWVTWSHAQGYNPHELQQQHQGGQQSQQHFVRPNRQEGLISAGPGMYGGPEYGGDLYGGGSSGGFYRPPGPLYGGGGQAGAYSGLHGSVIDPFQRENYGPRDVVPWSVQVGTSLTVNDDGRRSRRQFYVQSQRHRDDMLG